MAPTAPQMMARFCKSAGKFLAAIAMTIALSPAKTKSITMMAKRADKNSGENISKITPSYE